jgi:hypothetical protein
LKAQGLGRHRKTAQLAGTWLLLLLVVCAAPPLLAESQVVRYPRSFSGYEYRDSYVLELLQLALAKAGSKQTLQPSAYSMEQQRALTELEHNHGVDVVWSMTSAEREARLLPVRIGIDKGLMGWRIALLPKSQQRRLKDVHSLADLHQLRAGQGHDWPDRKILEYNGLPVVPSSSYESLFRMLTAGRFDYFPRSLLEIWDEVDSQPPLELVVDPYLVLHYPTASYFFVSRHNPQLAETLRQGLERALLDGSFDQLFMRHYGESLRQAKLSQRRILELDNPLLPVGTPLTRRELWLSREDLLQLDQPLTPE